MTEKKKSAVRIKPSVAGEGKKSKKIWNVLIIVLGVLLCVCMVGGLAVWLIFQHYYDKMDYVPDDQVTQYVGRNEDDMPQDEDETLSVELKLEFESIEEARQQVTDIEIPGGGYVYNILLIGLDLREGETWNGNSDSMILASINQETKEITLTSFMRDLYSIIPGVDGPKKLNYAHAKGGGPLLVQTIEELYKIDIDNYATVNFYDMIKIIDALGGLDIDVTDEEAAVANQYYVPYLAKETGVDAADYQLTGGTVHLNGLQAVAFSRIRYTEGSDYARTERQRKVLSLMFDKVGKLSLSELNAFLDVALPCVTHNIDEATMATLLASAPGYLSYTLVTNRVPYDGYFYEWNEMLVPDFEYTINMLHSQIYRVN
jgi:LCP family protein required for cell wall assembly